MDTNTIRRIAHETGMFGPEFNVTGEQCDKFASALISATVDSVARTWDGCMVPMFDPAGNTTGVIDIGATIRADGVLSAAGLVDSLPDMQGEPVDRLANLQAAVLSEVVKWALAGHIGEMGVTVEAGRAIRAVTSGVEACLSLDGQPNHCVLWKCHEAKACARGVAPTRKITSLDEFFAEAERTGFTAADLAEGLRARGVREDGNG